MGERSDEAESSSFTRSASPSTEENVYMKKHLGNDKKIQSVDYRKCFIVFKSGKSKRWIYIVSSENDIEPIASFLRNNSSNIRVSKTCINLLDKLWQDCRMNISITIDKLAKEINSYDKWCTKRYHWTVERKKA